MNVIKDHLLFHISDILKEHSGLPIESIEVEREDNSDYYTFHVHVSRYLIGKLGKFFYDAREATDK